MVRLNSRLFVSCICICLLVFVMTGNVPLSVSQEPRTVSSVPIPGTSVFDEDFTTSVYEDSGTTTAVGWGANQLTRARITTLQLLDHFSTTNAVRSVDVQGRKAYAGIYRVPLSLNALQVFDLTNPSTITSLTYRVYPKQTYDVLVDGDVLYAGSDFDADGDGDIFTYNVSNPTLAPIPNINGFNDIYGLPVGLAKQGHFLYVAAYHTSNGRFDIYDVEDPANIVQVSSWGWARHLDVRVEGRLSYHAHSTYGLKVVNVSNPYSPFNEGSVNTPGNATSILVDGDVCYVADGGSGLQVVDVSNPASPVIIGSHDTPGNAVNLALQGDTLFVADRSGGVRVFDVSDPSNPVAVTSVAPADVYDVALYGGVLVVAASDGLYTYSMGGLTTLDHYASYSAHEAWDVRVRGDVAYVAAGADGFLTLDVSDPANPILLDQYDPGSVFYRKLDIQGHLAFVTNYGSPGSWLIFDVSDPSDIQQVWAGSGTALLDMFAWGDVVFYTFGTGYGILNISNPYSPTAYPKVISVNTTACWAQGSHLYMVADDATETLTIYDLTTITNPSKIYSWGYDVAMYDIYVDGDLAYAAWGHIAGFSYGSFGAFNITDPYNTYWSDINHDFQSNYTGVWGFEPYLVTTKYTNGIRTHYAGDITNIIPMNTYSPASQALQLTIEGDFLYVANRNSLEILRLFRSTADTYNWTTPSIAQSLEVDSTDRTIENATLTLTGNTPYGTSISCWMSANGGANWELVYPGVAHTFSNQGNDLRFRFQLNSAFDDRTARIDSLSISYDYNDLPTTPVLTDPGTTDPDGAFTVSWSASTDASGSVASYQLQRDISNTFSAPTSYVATTTSHDLTGLTNDTYYFRVRALDDDGEYGDWSNTESIIVAIPPTTTTPPPPPNFMPLIIGVIIVVIVVLVLLLLYFLYFKKKK